MSDGHQMGDAGAEKPVRKLGATSHLLCDLSYTFYSVAMETLAPGTLQIDLVWMKPSSLRPKKPGSVREDEFIGAALSSCPRARPANVKVPPTGFTSVDGDVGPGLYKN